MNETLGQRRDKERGLRSLDVIAAALQLPALEQARAAVDQEVQSLRMEEDEAVIADAERRLAKLDENIERAQQALGIPVRKEGKS